jgi:hypothetical protein
LSAQSEHFQGVKALFVLALSPTTRTQEADQVIRTKTIDAPQKPSGEAAMHAAALILRGLVNEREWVGTVGELVVALKCAHSADSISPARFAIWLRRHEPTLWWDYGLRVGFSRTGQQRIVHLSRRD